MVEPAKLLQSYKRGLLTRHELIFRLCQTATERAPTDIASELPSDVLAEVREMSSTPPESPDHCRIVGMGSYAGVDAEMWNLHFREESQRLYDGLWLWHRHFADSSQPS